MSQIKSYTVVKGDNLTKIAKANNTTVNALLGANKDIKNPNLILVGQEIKIPEAETVDLSGGNEIVDVTPQPENNEVINNPSNNQAVANNEAGNKIQNAISQQQLDAAKQQEAERRAAGQVSETANIQIEDKMKEAQVEENLHNEPQQTSVAEANAEQLKDEGISEQQVFEKMEEDMGEAALEAAATTITIDPAELLAKVDNVRENLPLKDYAGGNGKKGKCSLLARHIMEALGLVKEGTTNSPHGKDYARNLAENSEQKLKSGFDVIGKDIKNEYGNENAAKVFEELLNGGNFAAITIGFESTGHYGNSGVDGHVIVVTGYDPNTKTVYLIDNYNTNFSKRGTQTVVCSLDEFENNYFFNDGDRKNTIDYMTAVIRDNGLSKTEKVAKEAAIQQQEANAQKIQETHLDAAKQQEEERRQAGQASSTENQATQLKDELAEAEVKTQEKVEEAQAEMGAAQEKVVAAQETYNSQTTLKYFEANGPIHTKNCATDSFKSQVGIETSGHPTYKIVPDGSDNTAPGVITESEYQIIIAQVAGEGGKSAGDIYGVASSIFNRRDAGGGYGNSFTGVLETGYWPWGKTYKAYLPGGSKYNTDSGQEKLMLAKEAVDKAMSGLRNLPSNGYYYHGDGTYNYFSDTLN